PRRWGRRIGVVLLVLVVLLVGLGVWVDSRLNRVDALADYEARPAATPGTDWLIVGSDSRQGLDEARRREPGTGQAAGRRAHTTLAPHSPPRPAPRPAPRPRGRHHHVAPHPPGPGKAGPDQPAPRLLCAHPRPRPQ